MGFLNGFMPRAKMDCCNRPWTVRLGGFVRATQRPVLYARQNAMAKMLFNVANLCGSVIWVSSNPKPRGFTQENSVSIPQRRRYLGSADLILILLVATINISPVFKPIMAILIGVVRFPGPDPDTMCLLECVSGVFQDAPHGLIISPERILLSR